MRTAWEIGALALLMTGALLLVHEIPKEQEQEQEPTIDWVEAVKLQQEREMQDLLDLQEEVRQRLEPEPQCDACSYECPPRLLLLSACRS